MKESKKLRQRLILAAGAVVLALTSISAATFAWYIYNAAARTTEVKLSAGSSVSLEISSSRQGRYASAAVMEDFKGRLNPVSTDRLSGGFQKAEWFDWAAQENGQGRLFAALFGQGVENVDYHKTSLFLRTNAESMDIYLSDIGFEDANVRHPLSTALRLGLRILQADESGAYPEYVFEVNSEQDPNRGDNADKEQGDGHVLDSTKTDGSTVSFVPLNRKHFCNYDAATGLTSLNPDSRRLCTLRGGEKGGYGEPVEVEIYLWLEGCDMDCTLNLSGQTLKKLALSFAGVKKGG